jgi:hypothetical protein
MRARSLRDGTPSRKEYFQWLVEGLIVVAMFGVNAVFCGALEENIVHAARPSLRTVREIKVPAAEIATIPKNAPLADALIADMNRRMRTLQHE